MNIDFIRLIFAIFIIFVSKVHSFFSLIFSSEYSHHFRRNIPMIAKKLVLASKEHIQYNLFEANNPFVLNVFTILLASFTVNIFKKFPLVFASMGGGGGVESTRGESQILQ